MGFVQTLLVPVAFGTLAGLVVSPIFTRRVVKEAERKIAQLAALKRELMRRLDELEAQHEANVHRVEEIEDLIDQVGDVLEAVIRQLPEFRAGLAEANARLMALHESRLRRSTQVRRRCFIDRRKEGTAAIRNEVVRPLAIGSSASPAQLPLLARSRFSGGCQAPFPTRRNTRGCNRAEPPN